MNCKNLLSRLVLGVVFFSLIILVGHHGANAGDCRIIRITSLVGHEGSSVAIEPEITRVNTGTCVIWYNRSTSKVKIIFEDGKLCDDITDASVGFKFDEKKACYFTEAYIEPGGTASLQFNKKGDVEYILDAEGRDEKPKGRIHVRE